MSKHTPGPWKVEGNLGSGRYISGPEHCEFAEVVWCMDDEERSPECEGNACLIAAAPELLEALEEAVVMLAIFGADTESKTYKRYQETIAKAKGEE